MKPSRTLNLYERAVLFQFVIEKGMPSWAKNDPIKVFARLTNVSDHLARKAYQQACNAGYLDKRA
jgi:hypothetical protein